MLLFSFFIYLCTQIHQSINKIMDDYPANSNKF